MTITINILGGTFDKTLSYEEYTEALARQASKVHPFGAPFILDLEGHAAILRVSRSLQGRERGGISR